MSSTQSRSHVLEVAGSSIWNEISYEAVNTSQNPLTGTLTCVLTRPLTWISVHNHFFKFLCYLWFFFWKGWTCRRFFRRWGETKHFKTCLLRLKLLVRNYEGVNRCGMKINCCWGGSLPQLGRSTVRPGTRSYFFPAGSHILTAGGWAGSGDPFDSDRR